MSDVLLLRDVHQRGKFSDIWASRVVAAKTLEDGNEIPMVPKRNGLFPLEFYLQRREKTGCGETEEGVASQQNFNSFFLLSL